MPAPGSARRCCSIAIRCRRGRAPGRGGATAAIVFGDRHGTTTSADLLDAAARAARALGYRDRLQRALCGRLCRRPPRPAGARRACAPDRDRPLGLSRRRSARPRARLRGRLPADRGGGGGARVAAARRSRRSPPNKVTAAAAVITHLAATALRSSQTYDAAYSYRRRRSFVDETQRPFSSSALRLFCSFSSSMREGVAAFLRRVSR